MITDVEEIIQVNLILDKIKEEMKDKNIPFDNNLIGINKIRSENTRSNFFNFTGVFKQSNLLSYFFITRRINNFL